MLSRLNHTRSILSSLQTVLIIGAVLLLSGCGPKATGTGPDVSSGPGGVRLGMTRQEVVQAMLEEVQALQMAGLVQNPYATRFVQGRDGNTVEVMYYYLRMVRGDNVVTEEELIPVILQDGVVAGWGWEALEAKTGSRPGP